MKSKKGDSSNQTFFEKDGDWWRISNPTFDIGWVRPNSRQSALDCVGFLKRMSSKPISEKRAKELEAQIKTAIPETTITGSIEEGFVINGLAPEFAHKPISFREIEEAIEAFSQRNAFTDSLGTNLKEKLWE